MSASTGCVSLMDGLMFAPDFTANELPTKKWLKLIRPRMRLRVRAQNRAFVSPSVRVRGRSSPGAVSWPWHDGDARFPRPSFADDDVFEVEVERGYWLWYRCIRRTKPVTIDQVRTGNHCALSLYDGEAFADVPEDRIDIGEIMFTLGSDGDDGDASDSEGGKDSSGAYM